jgi:flagellin
MSFDVNLGASQRGILFAMAEAKQQIEIGQDRLNTGKKINSASDDPIKFFTANTLENNAFDFLKVKDTMGQTIKALEATNNGLSSIKTTLDAMQGTINSARGTSDAATLETLSNTFTSLMNQVTNLANDTSYNGRNFIGTSGAGTGGATFDLTLYFGIDTATPSTFTIAAIGANAASIGLDSAGASWQASTDIDASQSLLTAALSTVRSAIQTFGTSINMLKIRDDFTSRHVKALKDGASQLVDADLNEEGAKLNALKMNQYIGLSSLGFSGQLNQGVLKLLG